MDYSLMPDSPDADNVVTASDLVRQFGHWQERAARTPVYILNRGRPRLVLASIDVMQALCAPHAESDDETATPRASIEALLGLTTELIVLADAGYRITAASTAALAFFGATCTPGQPVAALARGPIGAMLGETARRVGESGIGETIEIASAVHHDRRLAFAVRPHPGGLAIVARDVTVADERDAARGQLAARDQALGVTGLAATARINLRGYLQHTPAPLCAITGLSPESLAQVRFVSLVDVASRVAVAEAIEAVISDSLPRAIDATLLVNRASPRAVRIGIGPDYQGGMLVGVFAAIIGHDRREGH